MNAATPDATAQRLIALFDEAGVERARRDGVDYRPFDDAALDSFAKISLYMEIECEFGIRLSPEELLDERCRSLAGLAALIYERCVAEPGEARRG